jgi:hypothetical protein
VLICNDLATAKPAAGLQTAQSRLAGEQVRFGQLCLWQVMYNFNMLSAPRQDWTKLAELSQASDAEWLRNLSLDDRYAIYRGLFNAVRSAGSEDSRRRVEEWAWRNKLELLRRQREAFQRLDRQRDRSPERHSG